MTPQASAARPCRQSSGNHRPQLESMANPSSHPRQGPHELNGPQRSNTGPLRGLIGSCSPITPSWANRAPAGARCATPPPFGKWDFPTNPIFASSPRHFKARFCRFIPTNVGRPDGEPNVFGFSPSRKLQIGIWALPGPHLGTGPLAFNLPRKSGVPRAQPNHHRLRLTETVSLLQKLWGYIWICQSGAPKTFSGT